MRNELNVATQKYEAGGQVEMHAGKARLTPRVHFL